MEASIALPEKTNVENEQDELWAAWDAFDELWAARGLDTYGSKS